MPDPMRDPSPEPLPPIPVPPFPDPAPIRLVPLAEIEACALTRDRTGLDAGPLTELEISIAASGLRQPIEIFPLAAPYDGMTFGLLSGYRRLYAFRNLLERTRQDRYAVIPAFVRERRDLAEAMAAMIEENEIRAGISPYERGLICVMARNQGAFGSIEQAVDGLYPNADRNKRTRLRAIAHFAEEIGGFFSAPEKLSQQQIGRIMQAHAAGFGDLLRTALEESSHTDPAHQWLLTQPILDEAEDHARNPEPSRGPGRPRRVVRLRRALTVRRERTRDGWCVHFTGPEATGPLMDLVLDEIERMYMPG
jgi:ParB family chromosome partitioning protein